MGIGYGDVCYVFFFLQLSCLSCFFLHGFKGNRFHDWTYVLGEEANGGIPESEMPEA